MAEVDTISHSDLTQMLNEVFGTKDDAEFINIEINGLVQREIALTDRLASEPNEVERRKIQATLAHIRKEVSVKKEMLDSITAGSTTPTLRKHVAAIDTLLNKKSDHKYGKLLNVLQKQISTYVAKRGEINLQLRKLESVEARLTRRNAAMNEIPSDERRFGLKNRVGGELQSVRDKHESLLQLSRKYEIIINRLENRVLVLRMRDVEDLMPYDV